jgi:hypothetical protein
LEELKDKKRRSRMVTCSKCGKKNEGDAKFCVNCGAPLYIAENRNKREDTCFGQPERGMEEECFGLPFGGAIVGVIVGLFIIILGLSIAFEFNLGRLLGPFLLIIVGVLVIAGTVYSRLRRRS